VYGTLRFAAARLCFPSVPESLPHRTHPLRIRLYRIRLQSLLAGFVSG
jgi:hypothetical protein